MENLSKRTQQIIEVIEETKGLLPKNMPASLQNGQSDIEKAAKVLIGIGCVDMAAESVAEKRGISVSTVMSKITAQTADPDNQEECISWREFRLLVSRVLLGYQSSDFLKKIIVDSINNNDNSVADVEREFHRIGL